jgi:hypothetical protein
MEESPVIVASGLVRYYPEHQLLASGNYHITLPEKQLSVLDPLVENLGELVLTDELIDRNHLTVLSDAERYRQRLRVQSYVTGLRKNFDRLIYGLGDPKNGAIANEFGLGYTLCKFWVPEC